MGFEELREEYEGRPLDLSHCDPEAMTQFARWYGDAESAGIPMANAMSLATVGVAGRPANGIVLMKGFDEGGIVFYTNYESRKGRELEEHPWASLVFWWHPLHRQIRVEGRIERTSPEESDSYFSTRPRASNLSAIASPQSQVIDSRETLLARVEDIDTSSPDELSRPSNWGGYRVQPDRLEFWQGRPDRAHDRIEYRKADAGWSRQRLAP